MAYKEDICIFRGEELKHLCSEESCNVNKRCITKSYEALIKDYIKVKSELEFFGKNNGCEESSKDKS